MTITTCFGAGIVMRDYCQEEYLDGVLVQYSVGYAGSWTLAYFAHEDDAVLFARAKADAARSDAIPDYNV